MAILTVDELRKHLDHPSGEDADDVLQRLLDAATAEVERLTGTASVTELVDGGWETLILSRPIGSVTSVTVDFDGTPLLLAADDYRHLAGGYVLRRLSNGTNPGSWWTGTTQVVYTPTPMDAALIEAVIVDLVRLDISTHPGLQSMTIGDWSETYASNSVYNPSIEREYILARLTPDGPRVVVV